MCRSFICSDTIRLTPTSVVATTRQVAHTSTFLLCLNYPVMIVRASGPCSASYTLDKTLTFEQKIGRRRSIFYRAMHFSAKRGIAIACRLSVCPSVRPSVCDVGEL